MTSLNSSLVDAQQEMILELALGLEPPEAVIERYGYAASEYPSLAAQPWFYKALSDKKAELEKFGFSFQAKMGLMAEDLLVDIYRSTVKRDIPVSVKLEVAKYLTKIADKEPKTNAVVQPGAGFSISINFSQPEQHSEPKTLPPENANDEPLIIDQAPTYTIPDFDLNNDLSASLESHEPSEL